MLEFLQAALLLALPFVVLCIGDFIWSILGGSGTFKFK